MNSPTTEDHARVEVAPHGLTSRHATAATSLVVLGVVYGDIGTSPLYALKASLLHFAADGIDRGEVLGILSLLFWSLILVVTVKYVAAHPAGGQPRRGRHPGADRAGPARSPERANGWRRSSASPGPACSSATASSPRPSRSSSAMEGLKVVSPAFEHATSLPLSVAIIVGLFLVQYRGTGADRHRVRPDLRPVVPRHRPARARSKSPGSPWCWRPSRPTYGYPPSSSSHGWLGLRRLRLGLPGGDRRRRRSTPTWATSADGRSADAWFSFVLPALTLNYLGQGALLLSRSGGDREPLLPAGAGVAAPAPGVPGGGGDRHRLPGGDLGRLLAGARRRSSSASCRACQCATPAAPRRGRSTCPRSTSPSWLAC